MKEPKHPLLVADKAKHVGDAIAIVIAESRKAEAVDAAETIVVEYEELPAIVDASKKRWKTGSGTMTARPTTFALTGRWATRLKKLMQPLQHQRMLQRLILLTSVLFQNAIEPRAYNASCDQYNDKYTLYTSTQNPHLIRLLMCAFVLGIPEHRVRVVGP